MRHWKIQGSFKIIQAPSLAGTRLPEWLLPRSRVLAKTRTAIYSEIGHANCTPLLQHSRKWSRGKREQGFKNGRSACLLGGAYGNGSFG